MPSRLKIAHTSIIYQGVRLSVKALVLPTKESKQLFDDIGFIILNEEFTGKWRMIEVYKGRRKDKTFEWFKNLTNEDVGGYKVIGYAMKKGSTVIPIWKTKYDLTELNVVLGIKLCQSIMAVNATKPYQVPCYHSCSHKNYLANDTKCTKYLGTLGGAVINIKTKKLCGVATWAEADRSLPYNLPVGFTVPNSDSYFEDYACSVKIRNSKANAEAGYYQKLCDSVR